MVGLPRFSLRMGLFDSVVARAILFLLILLLVLPFILSLFVAGIDFQARVRTVFLLQKLYLFTALSTLLLIFLVRPKGFEVKSFGRRSLYFALLYLLFFALAFSTQLDIDRTLAEGVSVVDEGGTYLDLDAGRYIAPYALSDSLPISPHFIEKEGEFFLKEISLDEVPAEAIEVKFLVIWRDVDNRKFDSKVKMLINENEFNITGEYKGIKRGKIEWIAISVPGNAFKQGVNKLSIKLEKAGGEKIGLFAQAAYFNNNSFIFSGGMHKGLGEYHEYIWLLNKPNDSIFSQLFKLGFVFRLLGILFLFLAFFGLGFLKQLLASAKKEMVFSTLFAFAIYWFSIFLRSYWQFFSFIVAKSIYYIYKLLFLNPTLNLQNPALPRLGVSGFVAAIAETCSGVESMGYFLIAYTALIAFNWHRINLKKAALLYVPGLLGIFLVNILRVALIILIGAFYSREFALNAFHTNAGMIMFVIYFIIFWPLAMRCIKKK